ncbi:MAG: hypothetical protein M1834_004309 [Cirrosporium novae-zelandiae]|nr:MAG: hypothetical protein M1834_004309 [Cirrosporium novae-zelandiae]
MGEIECTDVTPECPVEASIYGYVPNLAANAFFLGFFAAALIAQIIQGLKWRLWTFMIAMTLGCLTEAIGYFGRILLNNNVFSDVGFEMQICCLTIAPAFMSAALYLTLKHLVIAFGEEYSFIKARLYTWIFISCDLLSLCLQGAGGGIAASADTQSASDIGTDIMLTGIIWQVITLFAFAALSIAYYLPVRRHRHELDESAKALLSDRKFKLFISSLIVAYITIFVRCVYRIAEMAGGWRNDIMQDETGFIALEGVMITAATLAFTLFHPGFCFPQMRESSHGKKPYTEKYASTSTNVDV